MAIRRAFPPLATLLWLLAAAPVAADCELPGPIEEELARAPIAFVGTVVGLDKSVATFEVREVWAGDIPALVSVYGFAGPDGPPPGGGPDLGAAPNAGMAPPVSEDDRSWLVGETYLVLPYLDGGSLHDSICTATTPWRAELADLRPDEAGDPAPAPASPSVAAIAVVAVAALLLGAGALAFRRR